MIEVEDVRKQFGTRAAVSGASFTATDASITGLLGPNGAGKTTSLRMIYGLMQPDAGRIRVDQCDPAVKPQAVQARIGVLPDQSGLYGRLTTREHIRYFGNLHGLRGVELEKRIERWVELLDLQKLADVPVAGFSHGERTKVALARALVHEPQNVLLDEPTNGLDVMSTRALRKAIRHLKENGRCVLFSSHVMQEVTALCDRIVVMVSGRVVAAGTARELLDLTRMSSLEDAFVTLTEGTTIVGV